jgi:hypothetical protein
LAGHAVDSNTLTSGDPGYKTLGEKIRPCISSELVKIHPLVHARRYLDCSSSIIEQGLPEAESSQEIQASPYLHVRYTTISGEHTKDDMWGASTSLPKISPSILGTRDQIDLTKLTIVLLRGRSGVLSTSCHRHSSDHSEVACNLSPTKRGVRGSPGFAQSARKDGKRRWGGLRGGLFFLAFALTCGSNFRMSMDILVELHQRACNVHANCLLWERETRWIHGICFTCIGGGKVFWLR